MDEAARLAETKYYIRNRDVSYQGNSPIWYGKNGQGYTAYILGAHRFTEFEAKKMVTENPGKWQMYKCDDVDARLHLVYDAQDDRNL
ncbi:hypothetical protein QOZ73_32670, partial [Pseudomonas aeruginosa]|uniref:hypothetical protein n=1 Tax=Pseudomonas aeruginosa TaxID=287 RepID=UPI00345A87AA